MARSGSVGGFIIDSNILTAENQDTMGGRFVLNPVGGYIAFINDASGSFSGIGSSVIPASSGIKALARFANVESNFGGTNIGMIAEAKNASNNIAIDIPNGGIRVGGTMGATFIQNIGGGYGLKFVNGLCVGAVGV